MAARVLDRASSRAKFQLPAPTDDHAKHSRPLASYPLRIGHGKPIRSWQLSTPLQLLLSRISVL